MSSAFPPPLLSRNGYPIPWRRVVSLACNPSHIAYYAPAPSSCLRLLRRRPRRVECAVDEAALAAAQAAFRDLGDVRVLVVANGKAGQGKAAAVVEGVVVGVLREAGVAEVVVRRTERPAHAVGIAREAMAEGFDCVIAAGGDGTLKEVVTGEFGAPSFVAWVGPFFSFLVGRWGHICGYLHALLKVGLMFPLLSNY